MNGLVTCPSRAAYEGERFRVIRSLRDAVVIQSVEGYRITVTHDEIEGIN